MTVLVLVLALGLAQPRGPRPFPAPAPARPEPAPASQPSSPSPPATPGGEPNEATLGVPVYPGAQFIASYDAGRGQRYYLFGASAPYVALVTYYRTLLKQRGTVVFEAPATHQFDIGRFREETMAFPPSITIKDYQSEISAGYPNPKPGGQPARFPTIIQIVPPPPGTPR
jgi:hypothetical protein